MGSRLGGAKKGCVYVCSYKLFRAMHCLSRVVFVLVIHKPQLSLHHLSPSRFYLLVCCSRNKCASPYTHTHTHTSTCPHYRDSEPIDVSTLKGLRTVSVDTRGNSNTLPPPPPTHTTPQLVSVCFGGGGGGHEDTY